MTADIRVVFDTSVVISAMLLPHSTPRMAFDLVLERGRLLVSDSTMSELDDVTRRKKFDKYVTQEKRLESLAAYLREAELVEVSGLIRECRDPKDDKFLELAVDGNASHLVSGDDDLLVLNPFRGIPVIDTTAFLKSVSETASYE